MVPTGGMGQVGDRLQDEAGYNQPPTIPISPSSFPFPIQQGKC